MSASDPLTRALLGAASAVDVPGTPRTLRVDGVHVQRDGIAVRWSFADPESPSEHADGRLRGTTVVQRSDRPVQALAREWWSEVQLEAGRRYVEQIDGDWVPGEPPRPHRWTVDEAWQALLGHLGSGGGEVTAVAGELRVTSEDDVVVYRIDPSAWAAYLDETTDGEEGWRDVVPAAVPYASGLPLWVVDELEEAAGTATVVTLRDGRWVLD